MIAVMVAVVTLTVFTLWFVLTQPFVAGRSWPGELASADHLERHVRALAADLPPRGAAPEALEPAARYVFSQFARLGQPSYQPFRVRGAEYLNVVLRFERSSDKNIIVGAHYDAYAGLPGADDNASGVAGLIELGRLLQRAAPQANIELVAYALEEAPHFNSTDMGSFHHASQANPDFVIVLEMIGYYRDDPGSQHYPSPFLKHVYADQGNFIAIIGRLREIPAVRTMKSAFLGASQVSALSLTFPPIVPGVTLSDHTNYWARGFRAVMVTDTAYERNPFYHTEHDIPDSLDYPRMAEVVTGIYASLFALADDL